MHVRNAALAGIQDYDAHQCVHANNRLMIRLVRGVLVRGRVNRPASVYLNTHVIQLPGYSTLDSPRTEQTAEASLSVRDSERCNRREPSVQMSPYYGNQRLSNSQTHEDVQSMRE